MKTIEFQYEVIDEIWSEYPRPQLVTVNPQAFYNFCKEAGENNEISYNEAIRNLDKVLPENVFFSVRSSINALHRYSSDLFPAFRELLPVFLTNEWSALTGIGNKFFRDHIMHQIQTAAVVKKLLLEMIFPIDYVAEKLEMPVPPKIMTGDTCRLLDVCAFIMLRKPTTGTSHRKTRGATFIHNYAHILGLNNYFIQGDANEQRAFERWRETIYVTAITAACYHDMGYMFSFAGSILRPLLPFGKFSKAGCFDAEYIQRTSSNALFMHNFTGTYDWHTHPGTQLNSIELQQIIQFACDKSHGLHTAHAFVYLNDILRDRDKPLKPWAQLVIQWAASAMLMHDLQGVREDVKNKINGKGKSLYKDNYLRVALMEDPVSFVLTLADQIQAYNRYSTYGKRDGKKTNLYFESHIQKVELQYYLLRGGEQKQKQKYKWFISQMGLNYVFYKEPPNRYEVTKTLHEKDFFKSTKKNYFDEKSGYLYPGELFRINKLGEKRS